MANEAHDPWALLREAEWAVAYVAAGPNAPKDAKALRDRIDAALAAHDAVPPSEEKVEFTRDWHTVNSPNRVEALLKDGTRVHIHKADINGTLGWTWDVEYHLQGFVLTLDEAKSAAIAAARGMR